MYAWTGSLRVPFGFRYPLYCWATHWDRRSEKHWHQRTGSHWDWRNPRSPCSGYVHIRIHCTRKSFGEADSLFSFLSFDLPFELQKKPMVLIMGEKLHKKKKLQKKQATKNGNDTDPTCFVRRRSHTRVLMDINSVTSRNDIVFLYL